MKKLDKFSVLVIVLVIIIATCFALIQSLQNKVDDKDPFMRIERGIEEDLKFISTEFDYIEVVTSTQKSNLGREALLMLKVEGKIFIGSKLQEIDIENSTIYLTNPAVQKHDAFTVEDKVVNRIWNKFSEIDRINIIGEQKEYIEKNLSSKFTAMAKDDLNYIIKGYNERYNLDLKIVYRDEKTTEEGD